MTPIFDAFSPSQLATLAAAYFVAALVKGITGVGYSSTCLPILTLAFGLKDALPMVLVPSMASNIVVMASTEGFMDTAKRFWPMLLSAAAFVFLGLWALTAMNGETAAAALGLVLVLYVAFALSSSSARRQVSEAKSRRFEPLLGAATGFLNGLTGSQVMPVVPYLLSIKGLARERFVQASNQSFTLSSVMMLLGLGTHGLLTAPAVVASVLGLLPVALGVRIGQRISRHLAPESFRTAVLVVLALLGLGLVIRAVV